MQLLPSWNQAIAKLTTDEPEPSDVLLYFVALQLLASCFTLRRASSANNFPLCQQQNTIQFVTALRLHSQYRFSPAAGHHARDSSESSAWPGLYTGRSLEDELAESVSKRRRDEKFRSNPTQSSISSKIMSTSPRHIGGDGWNDGPASADKERNHRHSRRTSNMISDTGSSSSSSSGSTYEGGLFTKLICQVTSPRKLKWRHHFLFSEPCPDKSTTRSSTYALHNQPSSIFKLPRHAVQGVPAKLRLERAQTAPKDSHCSTPLRPGYAIPRSNNSSSRIGRAHTFPFEIPEIRRISATTAEGWSPNSGHSNDMLTAKEYLDETRARSIDESRLGPFHAFLPPVTATSPTSPPSPMCSSSTIVPLTSIPSFDYLGNVVVGPLNDALDDEVSQTSGDRDDDSWSEDSIDKLTKRSNTVSRKVLFGPDSSERLQRQVDERSAEAE